MRLRKHRVATETVTEQPTQPTRPAWRDLLDDEERPSREDLAAGHDVFLDTLLEPVPMPRWLRGRRRARRDRLT